MAQPLSHIATARQLYETRLLQDPNIIGVGSGYRTRNGQATDEAALVVYVTAKTPPTRLPASRLIPPRLSFYHPLEGREVEVPTDVVEIGPVFALAHTGRYRPAPGGVSIGHKATTAGTLGGYVLDRRTAELVILSNFHVLAGQDHAQEGDPILQQGPLDGGGEEDALATLARWVPLDFSPSSENLVDAAVARPLSQELAEMSILGLGPGPSEITAAQIGMLVQKCGRTTERTYGARVESVDATFWVDYAYGGGRRARFRDTIILRGPAGFVQPGDSGSFVLTEEPNPRLIGLLFAGNASGTFSLANHIYHVFNLLDVGLVSAALEVIRGTTWQDRLAELRAFRDQVLGALPEGRKLLALLARHNVELWRILRAHPEIRQAAVRLVAPLLHALDAPNSAQSVVFDKLFFQQVRALMAQVEPLASLPLRKAIEWLQRELGRYEGKTLVEILKELKEPSPLPPPTRQAQPSKRLMVRRAPAGADSLSKALRIG